MKLNAAHESKRGYDNDHGDMVAVRCRHHVRRHTRTKSKMLILSLHCEHRLLTYMENYDDVKNGKSENNTEILLMSLGLKRHGEAQRLYKYKPFNALYLTARRCMYVDSGKTWKIDMHKHTPFLAV